MSNLLRASRPAPVRAPLPERSVFQDIEHVPSGGIGFSYERALEAVIEAQTEAERIGAEARAEAARIRARADRETVQAFAEARAAGYAEGAAEARAEAAAHVAEQVETRAAEMRAQIEAFCDAVLAEQARLWRAAESELKDLAIEIAARVLKAEVRVHPDLVLQITRHALRRLEGKDHLRIRVNPDDVERLREHRDELMALFEGLRMVEISEDRRVGIGGVQIETDTGTLDARIETQLGEIRRALEE